MAKTGKKTAAAAVAAGAEESKGSDERVYRLADLKTHNTEEDCWISINGVVYDVTEFLDNHPGGPEVMLEHGGESRVMAAVFLCTLPSCEEARGHAAPPHP
jgi:cytochrome b involved in lipid metabolism